MLMMAFLLKAGILREKLSSYFYAEDYKETLIFLTKITERYIPSIAFS